ncbi:efflux RND transporter periplasmic adaptor subunit [Rubinisphaera margarita]|uniref:efflux RND transporter periplasmic adaptor subunit n=1 Tax=Rubinisphaera margarita TaxID=2909586 RepID=UPI001EE86407|nr:efflux RND transporter periplasmic adaptor subunit [Rubinisphaera margarita]MCG6157861.1 efflux RND transporter periplasmic adaptor subunit [Rubinisphaera margarita]
MSSSPDISQEVRELLGSSIAWLFWSREASSRFVLRAAHGFGNQNIETLQREWTGHADLLEQCLEAGKPLRAEARTSSADTTASAVELIAIPLSTENQTGVLELCFTSAEGAAQFLQSEQLNAINASGPRWLRQISAGSSPTSQPESPLLRELNRIRESTPAAECMQAYLDELIVLRAADRCSLVSRRGTTARILAVSGAASPSARSQVIRSLRSLAGALPAQHAGAPSQLSAADLTVHGLSAQSASVYVVQSGADVRRPELLLIAEHFQGESTSGTSEFERQFPLWQLVLAGAAGLRPARVAGRFWNWKSGLAAAAVVAIGFIPVPFTITASGELVPVERQNVYAPEQGLIRGEDLQLPPDGHVASGEVVLRITSPELQRRVSEVEGEIATVSEQIRSLRNTRSGLERTSNEERTVDLDVGIRLAELTARLAGFQAEKQLLNSRLESLEVRSPIEGEVLTWDASRILKDRPVERGQLLLTVGDPEGSWEGIVHIRDVDLQFARQNLAEEGSVHLSAAANAQLKWTGQSVQLAGVVETDPSGRASAPASIAVSDVDPDQVRPGMRIEARFDCGTAPLFFVLFRGPIETLRSYLWW